jgi:hypothetical protein
MPLPEKDWWERAWELAFADPSSVLVRNGPPVLRAFVRGFGRVDFLRLFLNGASDEVAKLAASIRYNRDDAPFHMPMYLPHELVIDERLNTLPIPLTNFGSPRIIGSYQGKQHAIGNVAVRLHPCGLVQQILRIDLSSRAFSTYPNCIMALQETQPWREQGKWTWSGDLGSGTLPEIVDLASELLIESLFDEPRDMLAEDRWRVLFRVTDNYRLWNTAKTWVRAEKSVFRLANAPLSADGEVVVSGSGAAAFFPETLSRRQVVKRYRTIREMFFFVAYRHAISSGYLEYLSPEIVRLREKRLGGGKILTDDLLRFSAYAPEIRRHLDVLDRAIRRETPFRRALYSFLSENSSFDDRRVQLLRAIREWESEVKEWKPLAVKALKPAKGIAAMVRRIISGGASS